MKPESVHIIKCCFDNFNEEILHNFYTFLLFHVESCTKGHECIPYLQLKVKKLYQKHAYCLLFSTAVTVPKLPSDSLRTPLKLSDNRMV